MESNIFHSVFLRQTQNVHSSFTDHYPHSSSFSPIKVGQIWLIIRLEDWHLIIRKEKMFRTVYSIFTPAGNNFSSTIPHSSSPPPLKKNPLSVGFLLSWSYPDKTLRKVDGWCWSISTFISLLLTSIDSPCQIKFKPRHHI